MMASTLSDPSLQALHDRDEATDDDGEEAQVPTLGSLPGGSGNGRGRRRRRGEGVERMSGK